MVAWSFPAEILSRENAQTGVPHCNHRNVQRDTPKEQTTARASSGAGIVQTETHVHLPDALAQPMATAEESAISSHRHKNKPNPGRLRTTEAFAEHWVRKASWIGPHLHWTVQFHRESYHLSDGAWNRVCCGLIYERQPGLLVGTNIA